MSIETVQPLAFVLMPFDAEFGAVYEDLVQPALEEAGYRVGRADTRLNQQNVLRDIVRGITQADVVIAELTGANPNVLYELGLAHGLRIPTVLLAQDIEEVPFDLRSYRVQLYSTRFDEVAALKEALGDIARQHRAGGVEFGSPVTDFAGGSETRATQRQDESEETPDAPGFLDLIPQLEEVGAELEKTLEHIVAAITDVGEDVQRHATDLGHLESSRPGAAVRARRITLKASSDVVRFASRLEAHLPELDHGVTVLIETGNAYLQLVTAAEEPQTDQLIEALEDLESLLEVGKQGIEGMQSLATSMEALERQNVATELTRSVRRARRPVRQVVARFEQIESYCVKGITTLRELL